MSENVFDPLIIELPRLHLDILKDETRFQVVCAGRGFAKTGILLAKGALNLRKQYTTPNGIILPNRIMYAAPTIGEARDIAWQRAKELFDPWTVHKPNEQRLEIRLINNAVFFLRGLKKLNRIRGDYLTCFLADEFAFAQPDGANIETMWQQVIRPMLGKTNPGGEAMFASTPDGHNYFYQLFQRGQHPLDESDLNATKVFHKTSANHWKSYRHSTLDGRFVSEEEVLAAKEDMTDIAWRQEYQAEFIAQSGRVYYQFNRAKHLKPVSHVRELDIHWGWDFNIIPSVHSVCCHYHNGVVYQFDEFCVDETPDTVLAFCEKYPPQKVGRIYLYGDYTGNIATTGITDYQIIENMLSERGYLPAVRRVYGGNPIERDRTNLVNTLLENAEGRVRYYLNDKNCPITLRDFEHVKRKNSTGKIDKQSNPKLTHATDALGYLAWVLCKESY